MLNILQYPDPKLREVSLNVKELIPDIRKLIADMKDTMRNTSNAAGLSAIQVGEALRIIIIKKNNHWVEYINPVIENQIESYNVQEGCLSFPSDVTDSIPRFKTVKFTYDIFDQDGKWYSSPTETFSEFPAIVVQHEIDHLNGILMYDHMTKPLQKKVDKKLGVKNGKTISKN